MRERLPGSVLFTCPIYLHRLSHDDAAHVVVVAAGEKMLVEDGLGPEYSQDSSRVLVVEGG